MKKYTKDERISLLKEYINSGLSQYRFCIERNIHQATFNGWRRRFNVSSPYKFPQEMRHEKNCSDEALLSELRRLRQEKKCLEMELQRTRWRLEASEMMIDLAESKYHIKVRKNSGAK